MEGELGCCAARGSKRNTSVSSVCGGFTCPAHGWCPALLCSTSTNLPCFALCCPALCCALRCTLLHRPALLCPALRCATLCHPASPGAALRRVSYTALHCTALPQSACTALCLLPRPVLCFVPSIALRCAVPSITPRCAALCCAALACATSCCAVLRWPRPPCLELRLHHPTSPCAVFWGGVLHRPALLP
jgi:hypothetical protein